MEKQYYTNALPIGNTIKEIFMIEKAVNFNESDKGKSIRLTLTDQKGKCAGYVNADVLVEDIEYYAGKSAEITGFCTILNSKPAIRISALEVLTSNNNELIASLSKEEINDCWKVIKKAMDTIKNEKYKLLCNKVIVNKKVIDNLCKVPYSLKGSGSYAGAPLNVIASMLSMAMELVPIYNMWRSKLYRSADEIDMDIVLTAILLHVSAKYVEYTEYPFKAKDCVRLEGPFVVLWQNITTIAVKNKIDLNSSDIKYLCSAIQDLFRTETAPSIKEGILITYIRDMYMNLQDYDREVLNRVENEQLKVGDFLYSKELNVYLHKKENLEKGEQEEGEENAK